VKVVIFGATGMVGQGVLRECLLAGDVESVVAVVRGEIGQRRPQLREVVHRDFTDFSAIKARTENAVLELFGNGYAFRHGYPRRILEPADLAN
jgi:putative NADH-flavin reductase